MDNTINTIYFSTSWSEGCCTFSENIYLVMNLIVTLPFLELKKVDDELSELADTLP